MIKSVSNTSASVGNSVGKGDADVASISRKVMRSESVISRVKRCWARENGGNEEGKDTTYWPYGDLTLVGMLTMGWSGNVLCRSSSHGVGGLSLPYDSSTSCTLTLKLDCASSRAKRMEKKGR